MSTKILPLAKPPITTFPSYAAALGIMANYEESYDWFYSQYIQLCAIEITNPYKDENTHSSYIPTFFVDTDTRRFTNPFSDNYFLMRETCPYLNIFEIPNELISSLANSFINFIKQSIDMGMYIFTYLDTSKIEQYIPTASKFHEIFIYGYDDVEEVVYFADFPITHTFKYAYSTCKYAEIENAYESMNTLEYPLVKSAALIKFHNNTPYTFDMDYLRESISDYLNPNHKQAQKFNDYIMSLYKPLGWETQTYLGVDVYDFFDNHICQEIVREKYRFSLELFHGLYDHKAMMVSRAEHLMNKGHISSAKIPLLDDLKKIQRMTLALRNSVIKYNLRPKDHIAANARQALQLIKKAELELLPDLFDL